MLSSFLLLREIGLGEDGVFDVSQGGGMNKGGIVCGARDFSLFQKYSPFFGIIDRIYIIGPRISYHAVRTGWSNSLSIQLSRARSNVSGLTGDMFLCQNCSCGEHREDAITEYKPAVL